MKGTVLSRYIKDASGSKNIVILLLGWAGARNDLLDKYANVYQQRGYDTIRFTAELSNKTWSGDLANSREVSSLAENVKEALAQKQLAIHCFSMNGIYALCSLQLQYQELDLLKNAQGIIFDSSPISFGVSSLFTYLQVMDYSNAERIKNFSWSDSVKYKIEKTLMFATIIKYFGTVAARRLLDLDISQWSAYDFLINHPDMPKILSFVYSDADIICPPKTIQNFAAHWTRKGHQVEELHLRDSDHVLHMKKYPREYLQLIDTFLLRIQPHSKL